MESTQLNAQTWHGASKVEQIVSMFVKGTAGSMNFRHSFDFYITFGSPILF